MTAPNTNNFAQNFTNQVSLVGLDDLRPQPNQARPTNPVTLAAEPEEAEGENLAPINPGSTLAQTNLRLNSGGSRNYSLVLPTLSFTEGETLTANFFDADSWLSLVDSGATGVDDIRRAIINKAGAPNTPFARFGDITAVAGIVGGLSFALHESGHEASGCIFCSGNAPDLESTMLDAGLVRETDTLVGGLDRTTDWGLYQLGHYWETNLPSALILISSAFDPLIQRFIAPHVLGEGAMDDINQMMIDYDPRFDPRVDGSGAVGEVSLFHSLFGLFPDEFYGEEANFDQLRREGNLHHDRAALIGLLSPETINAFYGLFTYLITGEQDSLSPQNFRLHIHPRYVAGIPDPLTGFSTFLRLPGNPQSHLGFSFHHNFPSLNPDERLRFGPAIQASVNLREWSLPGDPVRINAGFQFTHFDERRAILLPQQTRIQGQAGASFRLDPRGLLRLSAEMVVGTTVGKTETGQPDLGARLGFTINPQR